MFQKSITGDIGRVVIQVANKSSLIYKINILNKPRRPYFVYYYKIPELRY